MADDQKRLQQALRHINALDRRSGLGLKDERAAAALREAEAVVMGSAPSRILAAWRAVRDSGVQSFDPLGGLSRIVAREPYEDNAMTSRRHG